MNDLHPIPVIDDAAQRRFHRFPIEGDVRLYSGNAMWNTRLVDLSLSGVLVERPETGPARWAAATGSTCVWMAAC